MDAYIKHQLEKDKIMKEMYGDVPISSIPPVKIGPKPIEVSQEAKT